MMKGGRVILSSDNFIDARGYTFAPFPHPLHPDEPGDSGALEIATSKRNPDDRYIIKSGYLELGCNELMYSKVAKALGLHTQEAKLVRGNKNYRRAAAIPYVADAREFDLATSSPDNFKEYFMFEALYIILNETDSREYYLDGQGRLFKLDNAASFTVDDMTIRWLDGEPIGFRFDINAPLNAVGYDWYKVALDVFTEKHGQEAVDAYLSMIKAFSEFDETALDEAYDALDKQYPRMLASYYDRCIRIRKQTCREFLDEIEEHNR